MALKQSQFNKFVTKLLGKTKICFRLNEGQLTAFLLSLGLLFYITFKLLVEICYALTPDPKNASESTKSDLT